MKKLMLSIVAVLLFLAGTTFAQTAPAKFRVHEHVVKPSMNSKFRDAVKKLKAACEQYKLNLSWTTVGYDDNSYIHALPLQNYADLDKNPFADLETKMGQEALGKIWGEMAECLESERDYVITSLPQFAYLTRGAEENHREVTFWYILPGKDGEAENVLAEWKKLNESKKVPGGYEVYKAIFGIESRYAIVHFAKDAVDLATKNQKTNELNAGEEANALWTKTMAISKRYFNKRGNVQPDLSLNLPKRKM
ncbi:MAG: hypothetical protein AABY93_16080 [Bacteroidota bacterium]